MTDYDLTKLNEWQNIIYTQETQLGKADIAQLLTLKYFQKKYRNVHVYHKTEMDLTVGGHRSGKSVFGMLRGELLDPTFSKYRKERVVYYGEDFMHSLNRIGDLGIMGGVLIWDEAGVGMPAKEWYKLSNRAINYALQVIGYLNPIIIFTTQDATYLDGGARKLLSSFNIMKRTTNDYSRVKMFDVDINRRTGKIYTIYPKVTLDHVKHQLKTTKIMPPPKELLRDYKDISQPYKDKIREQMGRLAKRSDNAETGKRDLDPSEIKNQIYAEYGRFTNSRSRPDKILLDPDRIAFSFKIPHRTAKVFKMDVERRLNEDKKTGA